MPKQKPSCRDAALKMLGRRAYAVKEMAGKLKDKQYPGIEIARTIDEFLEQGWLDDAKFAKSRARERAEFSKWGRRRIEQDLKQRGLAEEHISAAMSVLEFPDDPKWETAHDFQETATDLLNRRFGALEKASTHDDNHLDFSDKMKNKNDYQKAKKKRLDFLLRRGFSMAEALKALEENTAKD